MLPFGGGGQCFAREMNQRSKENCKGGLALHQVSTVSFQCGVEGGELLPGLKTKSGTEKKGGKEAFVHFFRPNGELVLQGKRRPTPPEDGRTAGARGPIDFHCSLVEWRC